MVIAIAFRICSRESILFRRFVINEIYATKKENSITLFAVSYTHLIHYKPKILLC